MADYQVYPEWEDAGMIDCPNCSGIGDLPFCDFCKDFVEHESCECGHDDKLTVLWCTRCEGSGQIDGEDVYGL